MMLQKTRINMLVRVSLLQDGFDGPTVRVMQAMLTCIIGVLHVLLLVKATTTTTTTKTTPPTTTTATTTTTTTTTATTPPTSTTTSTLTCLPLPPATGRGVYAPKIHPQKPPLTRTGRECGFEDKDSRLDSNPWMLHDGSFMSSSISW